MPHTMMAKKIVATIERPVSAINVFINFESMNHVQAHDNHVYDLDADEWQDDAPDAIDQQVTPQNGCRALRAEFHAAQRQRNQGDDDKRIENDSAQYGAV